MSQLMVIKGPLAGKTFDVADTMVIGRSMDCQIRLDDLTVSRVHARITQTPKGVFVEDMRSGNGTYVNKERINEPTLLKHNDTVTVSGHVLKFVSEAGAKVKPDMGSSTVVAIDDGPSAAELHIGGTLSAKDAGVAAISAKAMAKGGDALVKANERLRIIVEISNAVQSQLDLQKLLIQILQSLFQVFPQADRGFVMLAEKEGKLVPRATWTRTGETEEISISRTIINEVIQDKVAILSADPLGDSRFNQAVSIVSFQIRSMMCAPLIVQDDILGIIHIDTKRQQERFNQEDLELLTGVANQTALAIANAKMHERLLLRDRMERDLQLATQVQQSFLPSQTPDVPGMEFAASYSSALEVGGDFYDFIRKGEDRMVVVVGDVSGKGVPAALLMAKMTSDVRFFTLQVDQPSGIVERLNDHMNESAMEDVFVTLILISIDLNTHVMTVSNAAHCAALVRRAAEGDVVPLADEGNFPLGVVPGNEFAQKTYELRPGDVVCLYTDGVTEAMTAKKDMYGTERLQQAVLAAGTTSKEVLDAVIADVKKFVGDTKQSDDLTCVCFGVKPEANG